MPFIPLSLQQAGWRQFEAACTGIPRKDEWYQVESLHSGLWLCILKDGKSWKAQDKARPCPHDFIVKLYDAKQGTWVWQPEYTRGASDTRGYKSGLFTDLYQKRLQAPEHAAALFDVLLDVAAGAEPTSLGSLTARLDNLPGHAVDELLLTFKWLLAQEGVNYPIPRYGGRRYPMYRVQEIADGVDIDVVIARSRLKGGAPPSPLVGVDYARVDSRLGL